MIDRCLLRYCIILPTTKVVLTVRSVCCVCVCPNIHTRTKSLMTYILSVVIHFDQNYRSSSYVKVTDEGLLTKFGRRFRHRICT